MSNVRRSIVWTVEWSGIRKWLVSSTKWVQLWVRKISNFWRLLREKNSNNVQNVSFGWRKTKDATTWHANVSLSFVINVEEFIWNVSVWRRWEDCKKGEESKWNRDEGERRKEKERWRKKRFLGTLERKKRRGDSSCWESKDNKEIIGQLGVEKEIDYLFIHYSYKIILIFFITIPWKGVAYRTKITRNS